ncbi:hypothetical protein [Terriglobus sp. ADX1]|uniref:hypothetical protein n=1 Tax=Terriglobus sp. ADX1 TaxID=2794063 RepID=UPI002FE50B16
MSHPISSSASSLKLTPDTSSVSTLGGIWTTRHKEKVPVQTRVQAARLRMDRMQVESSRYEPCASGRSLPLALCLLAGGVIDYAAYKLAVHVSHLLIALLGGR